MVFSSGNDADTASGAGNHTQRTLRLGFEGSLASAQGVGAREMARIVDELSQGRIAIQLYPDAVLASGPKMIEMVQKEALDIFLGGAGYFAALDNRISIFDIPFLFENVEQAYTVMDSPFGREMLDVLDAQGLKGLSFWENGIRSFTNNVRPVYRPADLHGLKIRVMPGNQAHEDLWRHVGLHTTPLPSGAIYHAIQQGEINSQEHPVSVIYARKFYEVQPYLSLTRHMYGPLLQVMNLRMFNAMPPQDQACLLKASWAGAVATRTFSNDNEARFLAEMKASGLQVNEVEPTAFRDVMRPVIEDDFITRNGDAWLKKITTVLAL